MYNYIYIIVFLIDELSCILLYDFAYSIRLRDFESIFPSMLRYDANPKTITKESRQAILYESFTFLSKIFI